MPLLAFEKPLTAAQFSAKDGAKVLERTAPQPAKRVAAVACLIEHRRHRISICADPGDGLNEVVKAEAAAGMNDEEQADSAAIAAA